MKLRIRGNLLRFRLGRSEVNTFGLNGKIEESVEFGPGQSDLSYSLEKTSGNEFSGSFADGKITVHVPASVVDDWVKGEDVGIEGAQVFDAETRLSFLIEKDFVCLSSHDNEDQSDKYPHPNSDKNC